jgi:hypothetical protein
MSKSMSIVKSQESASITDTKLEHYRTRRKDAPPKVNSTTIEEEGEGVVLLAKYAEALGSISDAFRSMIFEQVGALQGRVDRNTLLNSALATLNSFKPRNEMEALLVAEIFTLHTLFAEMASRVMANDNAQLLNYCINWIDKLSRAIREHASMLQKLRGEGSQQKVTVEHVHVYQGGLAMVGAVNQPGERGRSHENG